MLLFAQFCSEHAVKYSILTHFGEINDVYMHFEM